MPKVGLVFHPDYLKHVTGAHPERGERLIAILNRLKEEGLYQRLIPIEPREASREELLYVHTEGHIERIRRACENAPAFLDPDTAVSKDSYRVALLAAGGVISACHKVMVGEAERAFCLIRPPGHHATKERAMGFCLFNNVAVSARLLMRRFGLKRVMIIDWDLHHGNGTQDIFYEDDAVFYISCHQRDHYPMTGYEGERGKGKGEGFTKNLPFRAGTPQEEIISSLKGAVEESAHAFRPEFILISAGFDAHRDDPLGGLTLTEAGYYELTRFLVELAEEHCGGRLVSCLEGGYNLKALANSATAHVKGLLGETY